MIKNIHAIIIYLSCTIVQAQPSLLSSEMLPFGSVMNEKSVMDLSVINTTIQGEGVEWDFSSITDNTSVSDLVITIVNPSSTPYAVSFPNSNYAYEEVQGASTDFRYFNLNDTVMERVGSYVSSVNTYSNPQIEYVFPLSFGSVNNDTWANTNSSTGGSYDLSCIGTGTLILPGGTYNALMVKVHLVESILDYYVYFWYSSDNGAILLEYIVGDGFFVGSSAIYLSSLTTGVGIKENEFITDFKYNNPVETNFALSFQSRNNEAYLYTVINSLGQKMFVANSEVIAGNTESLNIDFQSFPNGIYFLFIRSKESSQVNKTIKIVKI